MFHKISKILLVVLSVSVMLFSCFSHAGAGWRGKAVIKALVLDYDTAGATVVFENSVALNGCVSTDSVVVHRTLAGFKEAYSTLLAAYMAKKPIDVWVDGTCFNNNSRNVGVAFSI